MKGKVHLKVELHRRDGKNGFWACQSFCGTTSNNLTPHDTLVTCQHCLNGLRKGFRT